eukprot:8936352-Pyramimonas_sp.AAC.2
MAGHPDYNSVTSIILTISPDLDDVALDSRRSLKRSVLDDLTTAALPRTTATSSLRRRLSQRAAVAAVARLRQLQLLHLVVQRDLVLQTLHPTPPHTPPARARSDDATRSYMFITNRIKFHYIPLNPVKSR